MFRTRDFILIFTTVVFLVVAIGTTLVGKYGRIASSGEGIKLAEIANQEYTASVDNPATLSRSEHLAAMREKIAAKSGETISTSTAEPAAVVIDEATSTNDESGSELETEVGVQLCDDYAKSSVSWTPSGLQVEASEGARIYYHVTAPDNTSGNVATTGVAISPAPPNKQVVLQLPVRSWPEANPTCLSSDVIGIAQDGSLIKNDEVGLYGVFGSDTLIGYALDGFPIYGVADNPGDNCGGGVVAGLYRYTLSTSRDTIINCFSAPPVNF